MRFADLELYRLQAVRVQKIALLVISKPAFPEQGRAGFRYVILINIRLNFYQFMAVLYQKYRPQRFSEVVGQEGIVRALQNAAKAGTLAHAYLFTGSRGIGKTTIARLVAKAANCPNIKDGDPCGKCESCLAIAADNFLDVIEIDAASHTGVDNVRDLIEHVQFKPSHGRMKVFIIDEVHMLSKAAFNALLKTLEEPPAHAMFILATTDIEKVPDTIISRTQRFDFRKITPESMLEALKRISKAEKMKLADGTLQLIVSNSEGGMRDALSLLDTVASFGSTASVEEVRSLLGLSSIGVVEELMSLVAGHQASDIPPFIENLNNQGTDFTAFNRNVLEYLRLVLVAKVTKAVPTNALLDKTHYESLQTTAEQMAMPQLLFVIRLFLRSYKELGQSPSPELPLLLAGIEASLHGTTVNNPAPLAKPATALDINPAKPATSASIESAVLILPPEEKVETVAAANTESSGADITHEQVEAWWKDLVQHIKPLNSPLATLLKNSPLQETVGTRVTIGVKYLFHKEHLENTKNMALILETLETVSGQPLAFRVIIAKNKDEPALAQTVDALGDAIKIFGGELVE